MFLHKMEGFFLCMLASTSICLLQVHEYMIGRPWMVHSFVFVCGPSRSVCRCRRCRRACEVQAAACSISRCRSHHHSTAMVVCRERTEG